MATSMHLPRLLGLCAGLCLLSLPSGARASVHLSASLGQGFELSPQQRAHASNILITPGWSPIDLLRLELGVLTGLENARNARGDGVALEFRPMLLVSPPLIPVYGRVIFALVDPTEGDRRTLAYGLAAGLGGSVAGLGLFFEAGVLPRVLQAQLRWVLEGRAGLSIRL